MGDYLLKKGQVGLEFMMVVVVSVSTLIIFVGLLSIVMATKQDEVRSLKAQEVADGFSKELLFASEAESGFVRLLHLPSVIEGEHYVINLESFENKTAYFELLVGDDVFFKSAPIISRSFSFDSAIHSNDVMISKTEDGLLVEVVE